jgi:phosphatidylserine decarboxylase
VNRIGLEGVEGLFAANERICARMHLDAPTPVEGRAGSLVLVAVGATLVGSVRVTFDDLTTNLAGGDRTQRDYRDYRDYRDRPVRLEKGEEWGRFELGSSIVLVAEAGVLKLWEQPPGTPLRLGARIGTLLGVS